MAKNLEDIAQILEALNSTTIVSCPSVPVAIPGIGAGAEGALDAMGTLFKLKVPKRGVIVSATYYDLNFDGTGTNLYLFNSEPTAIADNAAWTLSDADAPKLVTKLAFAGFDTHSTTCKTSEINNIGKAYVAPSGCFWIQASCVAIVTVAIAPCFQLQIQSFDPDFKEA